MSTLDEIEARITDCKSYKFGMRNADTLAHFDAPFLLALVRQQAAALGAVLASIVMIRILLWPHKQQLYTEHYALVAFTVSISLVGVVLWGSVVGSMLPFILRRLGFDPAASSAPFVATLVDVTGIVIYFNVAFQILHPTLLK